MQEQWNYNPGYLPGDPRHGLMPSELLEFYCSRPATWLIRCTYGPDGLSKRESALPAHISYLYARRDQIQFVGPIYSDDGQHPIGSWLMIRAADLTAAEKFIAGEGFVQAGMIADIKISRFVETSSSERRQLDITIDPKKQLFLCELRDGKDGADKRTHTGPLHHAYQRSIAGNIIAHGPIRTDDCRRAIGSALILSVDNKEHATTLVMNEPMAKAGVFETIRISRWRFGKSINDR